MPFTAIFMNARFMLTRCKCWGHPKTFSSDEECPRDIWTECANTKIDPSLYSEVLDYE